MGNPILINHGSAGGTAINVDVSDNKNISNLRTVTLSAAYTITCPPGMPTRPAFTGASHANLETPGRVLNIGTVLTLLKGEADALVAAGKAA